MSRNICNLGYGGKDHVLSPMLGMETMQMKSIMALVKQLIDGDELRDAEARAIFDVTEINPWYIWVSIALLCLHGGDIEGAKIILDGLLCDEEL